MVMNMYSVHAMTSRLSKATLVVLILLLIWPVIVWGQGKGHGVEVRAVSAPLQEVEPGHIISLSFRVTSRTDAAQEFAESLELPPDWQPVMPSMTFRLGPGESTTRLVAFRVPDTVAAGEYEVTYSVRSQDDYAIQDADTVKVVVLKVDKLALWLEEKPDVVIAGETYQATLRVINQGNDESEVKLTVISTRGYPASIEPAVMPLAPGGSEVVTVTVTTDADKVQRAHQHVIMVNGVTDGGRTQVAVTVDIIPRIVAEPDLYHRIPATFTIYAIAEERASGIQGELAGQGALDEAGTKQVEFLFRGPSIGGWLGTHRYQDEYWLNYATDDWDVRAGDQTYGGSELTSYYEYGRGLGVDYHPPEKDFGVGSWYLRSRWGMPQQEDLGAYISHDTTDKLETRLNFVRRQYDAFIAAPAIHDTVWSLEGKVQPSDQTDLELEYGRSSSNRGGGVSDDAYRIDLAGRTKQQVYYYFDKKHAGADYYGYYHDVDLTRGAVNFPVRERLRGHASYDRWENNIELRPARGTASKEDLARVGLAWTVPTTWQVSLDYEDFEQRDRLVPASYYYKEHAVRLGLGRSKDKYSYLVELRRGRQKDLLTPQTYRVNRYNLFGTYRPDPTSFFTAFVGFGDDEPLQGSWLLGGRKRMGASARWHPREDLSLNLWYVKYNYDSPLRSEVSQLRFIANHALPDGCDLDLEIAHYRHEWNRDSETSYMLAYRIPLGLPVVKKKSVGFIRGIVFDGAEPAGAGIAGAIVTANDETVVTDAQGGFAFPLFSPGSYAVRVRGLGPNRVTERKLPIVVEVETGEKAQVDISVIEAARVSGRIIVAASDGNGNGEAVVVGEPGNGNEAPESKGLPGILVELTINGDVVRTVTNYEGRFLFEGLRPGTWHLKAYDHNLPPYHYLEKAEMDLELSTGQTEEVSLRVLPRERPIIILEEGEIKTNNNE